MTVFARMRTRWTELLTGETEALRPDRAMRLAAMDKLITNSESTGYWDTLNKSDARSYLWTELADHVDNNKITRCYMRLKEMAVAYQSKGSRLYRDARLGKDLIEALDWLHAHRYYKGRQDQGWYALEIGVPIELGSIMALLYDELTARQRTDWIEAIDSYCPNLAGLGYEYWGANRVWRTLAIALNGIASEEEAKMVMARDGFSDLTDGHTGEHSIFKYVTDGDGFYEDGSFIQHEDYAYTAGYGKTMIRDVPKLMYLLAGTPWEIKDPDSVHVWEWVQQSFEPILVNGLAMDMARGREISREAMSDLGAGKQIIEGVALAAQVAPPEYAARLERVRRQEPLTTSRIFAGMDRAAHHRPGWALGISMNSARQAYYEYHSFNYENKKGYYTAEGMTYLYLTDQSQYSDHFWPTADPKRLPGITVDAGLSRQDGSGYSWKPATFSSKSWAGGATLGAYGAAGMEQDAWGCSLTSRKSWFMFDRTVVALGSGITSTDGTSIETIVDNRKLNDSGNNAIMMDGELLSTDLHKGERSLDEVRWMHMEGNKPGSSVGYYFPDKPSLRLLRESRTHSWQEINSYGSDELHTRQYATIWFDHGINPNNASYAYVLLPGMDAEGTARFAASPDVEIWKQTNAAHVVQDRSTGIIGVNLWEDGIHSIPDRNGEEWLVCNGKASILVREHESELEIAIADPTQLRSGILSLTIRREAARVLSRDEAVTVAELAPYIHLNVEVAGAHGKTFYVTLSKQ